MKNKQNYILLWLSQSFAQLGSSMTDFALIIWVYKQTGSAMAVSLLTFFTYLPYVLVSIFAGVFVDAHKKKSIMLFANTISAVCMVAVIILFFMGSLKIWQIYIINIVTGTMNAFQNPALTVAIGLMVPKEKYARISGLSSFSTSLIAVVTPMLAAFVSSFLGLAGVFAINILTFLIAFLSLLLLIEIPENHIESLKLEDTNILRGCSKGLSFIKMHKGILYIILSMALLNFFSRLTYENILPAMILSRSGGDNNTLGIVSGILGIGGIIGGAIVSFAKFPKQVTKAIYLSAAISFLFGDLFMGIGQNLLVWSLAAIAASVPIPFITAGQNIIMYNLVPKDMQGRVFAARNAIQYFTIPIGILLGGALADYVFEPFMVNYSWLASVLQNIVGTGHGAGMAVMFLCTGILGTVASVCFYRSRSIHNLKLNEIE